jgi:hypothetical protein
LAGRDGAGSPRLPIVLAFREASKRLLFSAASQLSGNGLDLSAGADVKVFWFFSSEKNMLNS